RTKPEFEKSKKKLSQDGSLKQRIVKAEDHLKKLRSENTKKEIKLLIYEHFKDIGRRLEAKYGNNGPGQIMTAPTPSQLQTQMAPLPSPQPAAITSNNDKMTMMMSHDNFGMTVNNDDIMSSQDGHDSSSLLDVVATDGGGGGGAIWGNINNESKFYLLSSHGVSRPKPHNLRGIAFKDPVEEKRTAPECSVGKGNGLLVEEVHLVIEKHVLRSFVESSVPPPPLSPVGCPSSPWVSD
ncbi:agamous-like MADS-box protein AGL80-like, partial [Trifolium pratense]